MPDNGKPTPEQKAIMINKWLDGLGVFYDTTNDPDEKSKYCKECDTLYKWGYPAVMSHPFCAKCKSEGYL